MNDRTRRVIITIKGRSPSRENRRVGAGADVAALTASVAGMAVAAPLINDIGNAGPLAIALWRNLISVIMMVPVVLWRHRPTLRKHSR